MHTDGYIDESGDLGKSENSSKFFLVVGIYVNDGSKLERDIRKLLSSLIKQNKKRPPYFHASKESDNNKLKLIGIAIKHNVKAIAVVTSTKEKKPYNENIYKVLEILIYIILVQIQIEAYKWPTCSLTSSTIN